MSKKHYIALAEAFASLVEQSRQPNANAALLFDALVARISTVCAQDNSRFNNARFRDAIYKALCTHEEA